MVKARRVKTQSTTDYILHFKVLTDYKLCCRVTCSKSWLAGKKDVLCLLGAPTAVDQFDDWLGEGLQPIIRDSKKETHGADNEMGQRIPKVTEEDVERIIVREFGRERLQQVLDILHEYGRREGTRPGSPRVHLAILKIANGNLKMLKIQTENAIIDFRDVVSAAEYPYPHLRVLPLSKKIARMPRTERTGNSTKSGFCGNDDRIVKGIRTTCAQSEIGNCLAIKKS